RKTSFSPPAFFFSRSCHGFPSLSPGAESSWRSSLPLSFCGFSLPQEVTRHTDCPFSMSRCRRTSDMDQREFGQRLLQSAAVAAGFAAGLVAAFLLLLFAGHVFLLAFAGLLLAVFLVTLSEWLSKYSTLPYSASLAVVVF